MHPAWAAHGGLLATRLASLGAEGPPGVLEGRFGVYYAFVGATHGEVDLAGQLADLGEPLGDAADRLQAVSGLPLHPRLARRDGGRSLGQVDADEIDEIVVTVPDGRRARSCSSRRRRSRRRGASTRRSSASSTRRRRCSSTAASACATYSEEEIADPRVLALAGKVRHETKEYASYPAAFPGGVRIRMNDGRTLEADAPYQLGGPENPMTADEVRAKFRENAALALDDGALVALEEARADARGARRRPRRLPGARAPAGVAWP